ncbi:MAG TPA: ABC transporter permease, partial [Candidatus Angelobacter sp.]
WQDVRYGLRGVRRNPGFMLIAVLTLALGVGASSWLYSVLQQWVLDAVSYPNPDRLAVLGELDTKKGWMGTASAPDFLDWRAQNQVFETMSAWIPNQFNVTGGDAPERIEGARVSPDFFRTLDVQPALGRDFIRSDEQSGASKVAIISNGLWRDRFKGNHDLSDKTLNLDGDAYAIVGVMPEDFHFTHMGRANIWTPLAFTDKERADRGTGWLHVIARRKPGVTPEAAQQAMSAIARNLEKAYPSTNTNSGVLINSLAQEIGRNVGNQGIYTGFAVGICIALIACSNLASIYLARALARKKEMSVRLALGARKSRLVRQLLSENALLLPIAIGLGLFLAMAGGRWITNLIPYENRGYLPNYGEIYVSASTVLYALAVGVFRVLLFSISPLLEGLRINLASTLKEPGNAASVAPGSQRLRKALVISEIVLALTVLVPAGLTAKSLALVLSEDPGFRADHVLTAQMSLPMAKYSDKNQWRSFYNQLMERFRALPEVDSVGASRFIPFGHNGASVEFWVEGRPEPAPGDVPGTQITAATPGYLSALGLSLVSGRFLAEQDGADNLPVVVIGQTFAQRFFAHESPLGHRVRLGPGNPIWYTIVGVVKDVKLFNMNDPPMNEAYTAFTQSPSRSMSFVLHTRADPMSLSAALRNAVWSVDKEQPISGVETLEQRISDEQSPFRIFAQFSSYMGLLALFLAGIGIYGVTSYLVESRTREIGIRIACGAVRRNILWLVLSGNMKLVLAGTSLGLVAAWSVSRTLSGFLPKVTANDPLAYAASVAVLCIAILFASFLPLRRAVRVDPITVLRHE